LARIEWDINVAPDEVPVVGNEEPATASFLKCLEPVVVP
jgi:hypothetical protein